MTALKLAVVRSYLDAEFPGAQVTFFGEVAFGLGDTVLFDIADQPDVAPLAIARDFFTGRSPLEVAQALHERRVDHFLRAHPEAHVLLRRDDVQLRLTPEH